MRTASDRWLGALFHGWVELITLFGALFLVVLLLGWCWGRALRPADRGALVHVPMLLGAFGLVLVLRAYHHTWWAPLVIAGAMLIAGVLSRVVRPVGLWILVTLVATLIGLHLHLSALLLVVLSALALLFSSGQRR
jgi:hypothetical protein